MSHVENLINVNVMKREQYNTVQEPSLNELWVVKMETFHDDAGNWYRIYPDGWIEQGGRINTTNITSGTLTFLKPMKDTTYSINSSECATSSSDTEGVGAVTFWSNMTNTTVRYSCAKNRIICWEVKGYMA